MSDPQTEPRIPFGWTGRREPLRPRAAVATGSTAAALAARLLHLNDEGLAELRGTCGGELIVLLGDAERLPWVDGVVYLGRDERAPSLLLPTSREPTVPLELFERGLLARFPRVEPPLAVLDDLPLVCSLACALPIDRSLLAAFAARRSAP